MKFDRWVDDRLAALDVAGWRPNAARALAQLRARDRARRRRRAGFLWGSAAAVAAGLALMVLSAPQACATPNACAEQVWHTVFKHEPAAAAARPVVPPASAPAPVPAKAPLLAQAGKSAPQTRPPQPPERKAPAASATPNFKESGSPNAIVTCEIYTDYECPTCALLYKDTIPQLVAQYVKTGKVRLVHRDYPLPQHQYARLAARYANAAGRLGYYDQAVAQIFKTQEQWSGTGNIDAQLVAVLPPGVMQKVREMVANDASLEDSVEADMVMVRSDNINQTPTTIVVSKGKRQPVIGIPRWDLFKSYLDGLLAP